MENTMTARQITRRLDGSIDIDFYRQKGLMERRAVMTDFCRRMVRARKVLVAVAVIAAALYVSPVRDGTGWNGSSASTRQPVMTALPAATPESSPEEFRAILAADVTPWTPVVKALGLKID
jgi:hypothetical protein